MTRIGLDTSVVLRLLVGEPSDQAHAAVRFITEAASAGRQVTVSDLVVTEAYFALQAHYGVPKHEAAQSLADLLSSQLILSESKGCAFAALRASLASSGKLGFVDRLIHAQYVQDEACLATFEHAAKRLAHTIVLTK